MTILVAFASSYTSTHIWQGLLAHVSRPRLLLHVRSQESASKLKASNIALAEAPNVEFVVADPLDVTALANVMRGVDVVWFSGCAFLPLATAHGISFIEAAKQAGVPHLVLCSVANIVLSKHPLCNESRP
jgi:uncharacterized protein YbjT (DUF2867 family)